MDYSLGYPAYKDGPDNQLYQEARSLYIEPKKAQYGYGTAGFRNKGKFLRHVCYRSGLAAGFISKFVAPDAYGIIITASHNPGEDNGLKIFNESGFLLKISMEQPIQDFINAENIDIGFKEFVERVSGDFKMSPPGYSVKGNVFIAHDTRVSSPDLYSLAIQGIEASGSVALKCGQNTTPALQTIVAGYTKKLKADVLKSNVSPEKDPDSLYKEYIENMANQFGRIMTLVKNHEKQKKYVPELVLDCANGVGSKTIESLTKELEKHLKIEIINVDDTSKLNELCGGEYVQKEKKFPTGFKEACQKIKKDGRFYRGCALDGDADRTIYFGMSENAAEQEKLLLVEGDRLGILYIMTIDFLVERIESLQQKLSGKLTSPVKTEAWTKGIMQTGYANGGSTEFIHKKLKATHEYHATGVKHLHHSAKKFDIGVYFEANGHGTLLSSEKVKKEIQNLICELSPMSAENLVQDLIYNLSVLSSYLLLSNDVTGDAVCNLLLVESSLILLDLNIEDLDKLYADWPNKTSKCVVKKKELIQTTENELDVKAPESLKKSLDEFKKSHPGIRFTVRPSGTEDIVRIYVEAKTEEEVAVGTKELQFIILANEVVN